MTPGSSIRVCFIAAMLSTGVIACADQSLGDVRSPDGGSTDPSVSTCAAIGGVCGAATACPVGQGHWAVASETDCASTSGVCCLPESACPTETFMCCGATTNGGAAKARPLCDVAHPSNAGPKLVCDAALTPC